ncbi:hypothetical protein BDZ45DRAFT_188309 [Acephala macrosclerotiorum]|nr:hypothetical protein BDZ45DRAFT_188309 [Acephala macrosclerotiorum]
MGFPTTFHRLSELPDDVRERIWALAAGEPLRPQARRLIPLAFTMAPRFAGPFEATEIRPMLNQHIQYTFSLSSPHSSRLNISIWHSSTDSYRFYVKRNPNVLQLKRLGTLGQIIRFNAEKDHVFLSPYSLFVLWMYALERDYFESETHGFGLGVGLGPPEEQRDSDLIGFNDIRVLETSLPGNVNGLAEDGRLLTDIFRYQREEIVGKFSEVTGPALSIVSGIRVSAGTEFRIDEDLNTHHRPWIEAMSEEVYVGLRYLRAAHINDLLVHLAHRDLVANIRDFLGWYMFDDSFFQTGIEEVDNREQVSRDVVWSLFSVEEPTHEEVERRRLEGIRLTQIPYNDDQPPMI